MDELISTFNYVRPAIFIGGILYFTYLKRQIPRSDRGLPLIISGFYTLLLGSLVYILSMKPFLLELLSLTGKEEPLRSLSTVCVVCGRGFIAFGLIVWGKSVISFYRAALENEDIRNQLNDQNKLLEEKSRDLEIRTVDYLEQREAAIESEQSKTNFLRNTSHELRTPLNAIIGLSELLVGDTIKTEKERKEFSQMVLSSGKKLLKTIDTILEIARIKSDEYVPSLRPAKLHPIIAECVTLCLPKSHAKSIQITLAPAEDDGTSAVFDQKATHYILTRLTDNALTHSPENSELTIKTDTTDPEYVKIIITDQGPGIDPAHLNNIFEIFGRAERWQNRGEGGTGLGLALAYKMSEIQNGKLMVESDGKTGTTCILCLPANPDAR